MVSPTQALPPAEEREGLLDALAELIDRVGVEPWVCAPLLRPQEEFFPDPWTPDAAGVKRLALRLLRYAGLEGLEVSVELFTEEDPASDEDSYVHSERHTWTAAWFAGIRGGVAYIGANLDELDDPMGITAALAHEIAHAFRFHHELWVDELLDEEQLTDLTTVFLGFGLLTTNVALRHRSEIVPGSIGGSRYQWASIGYLSPQALSFLLACHQKVRGEAVKQVTGQLEDNQAHYYRKARAWLDAEVPDLEARLGMPSPSQWPDPWSLEELAGPLDIEEEDEVVEPEPAEVEPEPVEVARVDSRSRPVLRVPDGDHRVAQFWLGLAGILAALFVLKLGFVPALLTFVVTVVAVRWVGRRKVWHCSACDAKVQREVTSCPACNGMFVMDLEDPADRLDIDPWEVLAEREGTVATGDVYRALPDEVARAEPGPSAAQLDGSEIPRERGIMVPSTERVRVVEPEQVDALERRLGTTMPAGYRDYVTSFGEGIDSGFVRVLSPRQIVEEQGEHAERLAALDDADGLVVIARSEDGDLVVSEDGTLHLLGAGDDRARGCAGGLESAIEALLEPRGVEVRWFLPTSAKPVAKLVSTAEIVRMSDLLDLVLELSPVYLDERSDEQGDRWLMLCPGLGGSVRVEVGDEGLWMEIVTDREHREMGRRLAFSARDYGFDDA